MQHIRDLKYKGHERVIIKELSGKYIADVRADNYDGEILTGWDGLESEEKAILTAKQFINELNNNKKEG